MYLILRMKKSNAHIVIILLHILSIVLYNNCLNRTQRYKACSDL